MKLRSFALLGALASYSLIPLTARAATINPDAVAYQDDPAHDGSVTFQNFSTTPVKMWSVNLGGDVSYPLIAQGEVYVTAVPPSGSYGVSIYALNAQTGHIDWTTTLSGVYNPDTAAYDNGMLFVLDNNGDSSTMNAYNAATGALDWSSQLKGQYMFTSPPTASNGTVYVGGAGSGGTLYALRESNGATLWTAGVENGDHSSPTVTSNGVYVSYAGPQTYDFSPSGGQIWRLSPNLEGGGGKTAVYYNGNLYVRGVFASSLPDKNMLLLNATTGAVSTTFHDSLSNPTAPAFANGMGYVEAGNGVLDELNASSGVVGWSVSSPGGMSDPFVTAPTIINGNVFEGTSSGELYEFNGASGSLLDTINVGADIDGPDEQNAVILTGLSAGDGLLAVPAGDSLNVYSVVTAPEPSGWILASITLVVAAGALLRRKNYRGHEPNRLYPSSIQPGR